jgi:XTP/dITP diphosphohydrolase
MKPRICFASNNAHKLEEIQAVLPDSIELVPLREVLPGVDLPENQRTLEGNSLEKARYVFEKTGISCLADDSGLEVNALKGQPGVDTAHYAGPGRDSGANMALLLENLRQATDRRAAFRAVFTLFWEGEVYSFEGRVDGTIATEPRGEGGFGYDPVFIPEGFSETFAELGPEIKNRLSHRARATRQLAEFLLRTGTSG